MDDAGLGLGLAISRNILEAVGGQLRCSTQEGTGTTFSVLLPVLTLDPSGEPTIAYHPIDP